VSLLRRGEWRFWTRKLGSFDPWRKWEVSLGGLPGTNDSNFVKVVVASTPTEGGGHPLGRGANSPLAQGPTTRRSRDRLPSAPQGHSGGLQPLGPRPRGLQPLGPRPRRPTQRGWPSGKAGGGHSDARRARLSPGGCLQPPGGCLQPPDRLAVQPCWVGASWPKTAASSRRLPGRPCRRL